MSESHEPSEHTLLDGGQLGASSSSGQAGTSSGPRRVVDDEPGAGEPDHLNPLALALARELVAESEGRVEIVSDDQQSWLDLEEKASTMAFAEARGNELQIVPFVGEADQVLARRYVRAIQPTWLDGEQELVVDVPAVTSPAMHVEVLAHLRAARDYWARTVELTPSELLPPVEPSASPDMTNSGEVDFAALTEDGFHEEIADVDRPTLEAQLRADVSAHWSWASAAARIPQVADLDAYVSEPVVHARITVTVRDADLQYGSTVAYEGPLPVANKFPRSVHVPLSPRVMSQVEERRGAECVVTLEDLATSRVLGTVIQAIDIQPRDLWNWDGDSRHSGLLPKMRAHLRQIIELLQAEPNHPERVELERHGVRLQGDIKTAEALSRSLLASFVRPNHPEVAVLAREAATLRGTRSGESAFSAYQLPERDSTERASVGANVDASIDAVYEAVRLRKIAYSEPPPGWDYTIEGQRIRDHGDVARGGLGTCMDTTVLMAAVVEHVGLNPVLLLIPGHIFVGYWRNDPSKSGQDGAPDWYPRESPILSDPSRIRNLADAGYLGLVETTVVTVSMSVDAATARSIGRNKSLASGLDDNSVTLIDVIAARKAGVSPLPAVNERADGVTEIFEYRPGAAPTTVEVQPGAEDATPRERQVDPHPPRYRTWKTNLFTLNATSPLLNLGVGAKVQPLLLTPELLGTLEDKLNQDVSFSVRSGFDVPDVYRAREVVNAAQFEPDELATHLSDRKLYVQRFKRAKGQIAPATPADFVKELRAMAREAKSSLDERGMNPLFLCLGLLRWEPDHVHKPGVFADAPLILVPIKLTAQRGGRDFTLTLDASQHTTTNAALIEWLRREHGVSVPGLVEPLTDRAGIDVAAVINDVRSAIIGHRFDFGVEVTAEARLATLDLTQFRMWQDLNLHAESFLERPLVRHLVETPTEQFTDPAIETAEALEPQADTPEQIEQIDTPISADSTQKRAVLWARQGRTFVLQGPPGTGKSQTITNMVAECIMAGLKVLFVAEKGTALDVVQRRLDSVGLGPFTLNLHHEGSNATVVREKLRTSLKARVFPDPAAMGAAQRNLRNARFELMEYPKHLHEPNAARLSAYTARDQLLVLGDGPALEIPSQLVAYQGDTIQALRSLFRDLQPWTAAAAVRADHPWRLAGAGNGSPFDVAVVSQAITAILNGTRWASSLTGPLGEALRSVTRPSQLSTLALATHPTLPAGSDLAGILDPRWTSAAPEMISKCEQAVAGWMSKLHGFSPEVLAMDLRYIAARLDEATASNILRRKARQTAAIAPLAAVAPTGASLQPETAGAILSDLIEVQSAAESIRSSLGSVPGLRALVPPNPFHAGALYPVRARFDELRAATAGLRDGSQWTQAVHSLALAGQLSAHRDELVAFADAWRTLWQALTIDEADFQAWRADRTLLSATTAANRTWQSQVDYERLLGLQSWCTLVRKLEPLRTAGLDDVRIALLEGSLRAADAEDALARGIAEASLKERTRASGLDRFNATDHDQRVTSYSQAQVEVRKQWITDGPARLLKARGAGGLGSHTGGLARELEKTTHRLGTRPILRKFGQAVQELTPLVLASPSSVVDLIEPGTMEFDVVIFDEASQITVPEAVGALGRARAAIVVGDSKQMPPSRKIGGTTSEDEELDDPDADEIVEDQESILSECELARIPTLSLNWHYRSQDEALIAFSNRTYYRGDLSSFPTPTQLSSETGLEFRRIHWPEQSDCGMYLRAGSRRVDLGNGVSAGSNTNPLEAQAIVAYVEKLVRRPGNLPSIGIVTFNEQQRELITELLLHSPEPRVAEVMDEHKMGRGEVLFVKALEQVQGDERDEIIFSVAFSEQANGKIPNNFGRLNIAGGERRLNVAITRARRKNVVFCSFDPSKLEVDGLSFDGPKHLKAFLSEAKRVSEGDAPELGQGSYRVPIRDRHRDDIAVALREAGLHVEADMGESNFRIDLVLARPGNPTRLILPVLLDGETWKQRSTVSDRDVLPVEVLQGLMGWPAVVRIWWPMWLQNRQEVIDGILTAVDRAEANLDARAREPEQATPPPAGALTPEPPIAATDASASTGVASGPYNGRRFASPEGEAGSPANPVSRIRSDEGPHESKPSGAVASVATTFVPAHLDAIGSKDVLDELDNRRQASIVREQIIDVINTEGPVEVGRLVRIIGRRFGLLAVRTARAEDITRLIPRGRVKKSVLGSFAWPEHLDPNTWSGFRTADADNTRSLDEIAPEEIANAMKAAMAKRPTSSQDELLRGAAEVFGIVRLGANVRARLEAVYDKLPAAPDPTSTPPAPAATPFVGTPRVPTAETLAAPASAPAATPSPVVTAPAAPAPRPPAPTGPVVRQPDPTIDRLAHEAESLSPDLTRVDDFLYYDYSRGKKLGANLRRVVNEIVLDRDFDGRPDSPVAEARTADLAPDDADLVRYAAMGVWDETMGKALGRTVKKLVAHLAADPEFDPLPWSEDINDFVAERMTGKRQALVTLTQRELNQYAWDSGLIAKAEEEIKRQARAALDAMSPLERDIYGFATRNAKRLQLAAPYIGHISEARQKLIVYWMSRFDSEEVGIHREARYATASRALVARGNTRAAISRILGISTSVMDRIERENRQNVAFAPNDPILTELAPQLR